MDGDRQKRVGVGEKSPVPLPSSLNISRHRIQPDNLLSHLFIMNYFVLAVSALIASSSSSLLADGVVTDTDTVTYPTKSSKAAANNTFVSGTFKVCELASAADETYPGNISYPIWTPKKVALAFQTQYARGFAYAEGPINCGTIGLDTPLCRNSPGAGLTHIRYESTGLLPSAANGVAEYLGIGVFLKYPSPRIDECFNLPDCNANGVPTISAGYYVGFKMSCSSGSSNIAFYGISKTNSYSYTCETQTTIQKAEIGLSIVHMTGFGLVLVGEDCPPLN